MDFVDPKPARKMWKYQTEAEMFVLVSSFGVENVNLTSILGLSQ